MKNIFIDQMLYFAMLVSDSETKLIATASNIVAV